MSYERLGPCPQAMYQLQRGAMLGKAACHADERAFLLAAFTAAPVDVGLAMLAPRLHLHDPSTGSFQPVLACDLALTPGAGPSCAGPVAGVCTAACG